MFGQLSLCFSRRPNLVVLKSTTDQNNALISALNNASCMQALKGLMKTSKLYLIPIGKVEGTSMPPWSCLRPT